MTAGRVVVVAPRSGSRAAWGSIVPDDLAARPGVTVLDDEADPRRSLEIARELAGADDVYGVVGHFSSHAARAALPIYSAAGARVTFPFASADDVVAHHGDRTAGVLAPMASDTAQRAAIERSVAADGGSAVLVVVSPNSPIVDAWQGSGIPERGLHETLPTSATHIVVAGDLHDVVAVRHRLAALTRDGWTIVLTDDVVPAVDCIAEVASAGLLWVATATAAPATLFRTVCDHMIDSRDQARGPAAFVESWPIVPALGWRCTPVPRAVHD